MVYQTPIKTVFSHLNGQNRQIMNSSDKAVSKLQRPSDQTVLDSFRISCLSAEKQVTNKFLKAGERQSINK